MHSFSRRDQRILAVLISNYPSVFQREVSWIVYPEKTVQCSQGYIRYCCNHLVMGLAM